jgi:hypothetical protein
MPLQNRVTPFGEIEASAARGLFMGNRGILHDEQRQLGTARWRHKNWVTCRLAFKGRKRTVMAPGRYTELFFCDEAVALAAGHRPCAECRREDYDRFRAAWAQGHQLSDHPQAGELDAGLHAARVERDRRQVRFTSVRIADLPDGSFISLPESPEAAWLVYQNSLHRWSHKGYGEKRPAPGRDHVTVLTPEPTVRALGAGYRPALHPSLSH